MKCKRPQCETRLTKRLIKQGQVYCSMDCAPMARRYAGGRDSQQKTAKSIYQALGGVSPVPYGAGKPQETAGETPQKNSVNAETKSEENLKIRTVNKEMPDPSLRSSFSVKTNENKKTAGGGNVQTQTQNQEEKNHGNGIVETPPTVVNSNMPVVIGATQLTDSFPKLNDTEMAKSITNNLLDDSMKQLHGLLKSASGVVTINDTKIDPQRVGSVCSVAKQLTSMMRLKLDIYKETR